MKEGNQLPLQTSVSTLKWWKVENMKLTNFTNYMITKMWILVGHSTVSFSKEKQKPVQVLSITLVKVSISVKICECLKTTERPLDYELILGLQRIWASNRTLALALPHKIKIKPLIKLKKCLQKFNYRLVLIMLSMVTYNAEMKLHLLIRKEWVAYSKLIISLRRINSSSIIYFSGLILL